VEVSSAGPVYRWDVEENLGYVKERKLYLVTGMGAGRTFGVHNNTVGNLRRGLYERVLYRVDGTKRTPPLTASASVIEEEMGPFRSALVGYIPPAHPVTRDKFVAMYSGRKQTIYAKAASSLQRRPLSIADSYLSTFVKCEKIDFSTKPDPAPRMIQPRSPRFNVEIGRYLKPLEKKVVKAIADVWEEPTVMKGLTPEQVGAEFKKKWDKYADPVAIAMDAVKFDQHVNTDLLGWEHSCYLEATPEARRTHLKSLLKMQLTNTGFARAPDGTIRYKVAGRRASGDMNTGMGNCLIMCGAMWALRTKTRPFSLANNGDDCTLICERSNAEAIRRAVPAHFRAYGLLMEVESTVDTFEKISFCQTSPVRLSDGTVLMVRDPRVCLDKDTCTPIPLTSAKTTSPWLWAIGNGGMSLTGGVPIMQEFYAALGRHGTPSKVWDSCAMDNGFKMMTVGMDRKHMAVGDETRLSFWRAFDILPDMQVALEQEFAATALSLSAGELTSPHIHLRHIFQ